MGEDEFGEAEEGIGTTAGFEFINTKVLFCVPDFSGVFPGAQEEEEAAGGVPWGFVLLMQSRGWLRNAGSGAAEPQGRLTTESPGICSDLGICPKRREEEMLS